MKTLILDGIFVYDNLKNNYSGKTSLEMIYENAKKNDFDRFILIQTGKIKNIPNGIKNVIIEDQYPETILEAIIEESKNSESVVVFDAGVPFYDADFIAKMVERHDKYLADYTYAIGYPEGLTPVILRKDIIKEMAVLVKDETIIKKDYLFYTLSKDINSFDIETFLSDYDLRIFRARFGANDEGEDLLTKKIFDIFGNNSNNIEKITKYIHDDLTVLYTVPYMLNIELTNHTDIKSILTPEISKDRNQINPELIKSLIDDLKKINNGVHLVLGGLGEPLEHDNFIEIVEYATTNNIDTVIETFGLRVDTNLIDKLNKLNKSYITFVLKFDSYFENTYNTINKNGDFNKLKENYKLLKDNNFKVYKQVVRINENEEEIEKYIRNKEADDLIIRKYSTYCNKLQDKKVIDLSPMERIPCFHLRREIFVNSYGEVSFCSYAFDKIIGDLKNETLNSIIKKMDIFYQENASKQYKDFCLNCDDYYLFNF